MFELLHAGAVPLRGDGLSLMGAFDEAWRRHLEEGLVCPNCQAANRPGETVIEVRPGNVATCGVCRREWELPR